MQVKKRLDTLSRRLALMGIGLVIAMFVLFKRPALYYAVGPYGDLTPIYSPMSPMNNMPRDQYGQPINPSGQQYMQRDPYGQSMYPPSQSPPRNMNPFDLNAAFSQQRPMHDLGQDPRQPYGRA